jgi:hypothetical protein
MWKKIAQKVTKGSRTFFGRTNKEKVLSEGIHHLFTLDIHRPPGLTGIVLFGTATLMYASWSLMMECNT